MAKDVKNVYEIQDMSKLGISEISDLMDSGKTLLISLRKGIHVEKSLENKYSEFLKANIELKEEKANCGICGCGEIADILVYAWR
ncbi:hypothetical protein CXP39_01710 [Mesoplasma syrphidae]|uniref:Uncharacterized protein n=1 Tax=Mesoplasma syrphidae TaxID=225999 RepID=A0A2K9BYQ9_9MOLU|nr:hypothetical protein [Mesoplasma syrphidae]AUF83508.1 hypothetical protein CXP39_01710 [Mesoplasma syrphidae]